MLHERVKVWTNWQTAQQVLTKKRETKTKFELQGRSDKVPAAKREVEEVTLYFEARRWCLNGGF